MTDDTVIPLLTTVANTETARKEIIQAIQETSKGNLPAEDTNLLNIPTYIKQMVPNTYIINYSCREKNQNNPFTIPTTAINADVYYTLIGGGYSDAKIYVDGVIKDEIGGRTSTSGYIKALPGQEIKTYASGASDWQTASTAIIIYYDNK